MNKKVDYGLLAILFGAGYALVKNYLPDFPLNEEMAFTLFLYIIAKLGAEVAGGPVSKLF